MNKIIHILPHNLEDFMAGEYNNFDHHSVRFLRKIQKFSHQDNLIIKQELWLLTKHFKEPTVIRHQDGFLIRLFPISISLPLPLEISFSLLRAVKKYSFAGKTIWHLHSYYLLMNDFLSLLLALKKQRFVAHFRGGGPSWTIKACLYTIYHYLVGLRITLPLARFIFVQNFDEQNRLINFLRLKKNKVIYFPNSLPLNKITNIGSLQKNFSDGFFRIIIAGRIKKNFSDPKKLLILKEILKQNKNYQLEIIGFKDENNIVDELKTQFGGRIELIPWLDKNKLLHKFQQADLFLHLNSKEGFEGSPMVLVEAQSQGLPVVALDISGVRDIIKDGINGFLVNKFSDIPQKINFIYNSNDKLSFKAAAVSRIKNGFVDEKYFPKLISIYNNLLIN